MRLTVVFLVLAIGCTRANPDLVGERGNDFGMAVGGVGSNPGTDLPSERDFGVGPSEDLAVSEPPDLAEPAPDLAPAKGVVCGAQLCSGDTPSCCFDPNAVCVPATQMCNDGPFACDGREDCAFGQECCFNTRNVFSSCVLVGTCPGAPMCHVLSECPPTAQWMACCPLHDHPELKTCSRTACN
jgi:hypothetical protein